MTQWSSLNWNSRNQTNLWYINLGFIFNNQIGDTILIFSRFSLAFSLAASLSLLSACADDAATATAYNFDGNWYVIPSSLRTTGLCIFNITPVTITIKGQCSVATSSTLASLSPPICTGNSISFGGSINGTSNSIRMTAASNTTMTGSGIASQGSCSSSYDLNATLMSR